MKKLLLALVVFFAACDTYPTANYPAATSGTDDPTFDPAPAAQPDFSPATVEAPTYDPPAAPAYQPPAMELPRPEMGIAR